MDLEGFRLKKTHDEGLDINRVLLHLLFMLLNVVVERLYESSLSVAMRMMIHVMFVMKV